MQKQFTNEKSFVFLSCWFSSVVSSGHNREKDVSWVFNLFIQNLIWLQMLCLICLFWVLEARRRSTKLHPLVRGASVITWWRAGRRSWRLTCRLNDSPITRIHTHTHIHRMFTVHSTCQGESAWETIRLRIFITFVPKIQTFVSHQKKRLFVQNETLGTFCSAHSVSNKETKINEARWLPWWLLTYLLIRAENLPLWGYSDTWWHQHVELITWKF